MGDPIGSRPSLSYRIIPSPPDDQQWEARVKSALQFSKSHNGNKHSSNRLNFVSTHFRASRWHILNTMSVITDTSRLIIHVRERENEIWNEAKHSMMSHWSPPLTVTLLIYCCVFEEPLGACRWIWTPQRLVWTSYIWWIHTSVAVLCRLGPLRTRSRRFVSLTSHWWEWPNDAQSSLYSHDW